MLPAVIIILRDLAIRVIYPIIALAEPNNIYAFQVFRPYLGFRPDPYHFTVQYEGNVVKYGENGWGRYVWQPNIHMKH